MQRRSLLAAMALIPVFQMAVPGAAIAAEKKVKVAATFDAMAEIAKAVGGNRVTVSTLIPPGVEPHEYSPRPGDMRGLAGADLVIKNGFGLEPWTEKALKASGNGRAKIVVASQGVTPMKIGAAIDPHLWISPSGAILEAENIAKALEAADPAGAAVYKKNLAAFASGIKAASDAFRKAAAGSKNRTFVTGHAAFGYLCRDFGLKQVSVMKNEEYKKLSINEFTKAAGRYESNHAGIYEMCKKDYPDILEELEKEPFRDLLDAGCGPAPMISLLAEKYPDRHYTGLDLTPAMIEQAKKKNIPNATFVVGDCENFPFEKDSFDAIICSMSFHHYPDPQAFFDSVKRCLRPNGRLILWDVTSDNKVLVWLMNTLEMPLANICGHGDVRVPTRDVVMECSRKAGLKVEKFEIRKGMRMHCVVRKPIGKGDR